MEDKNEFPEDVMKSVETIARWLAENHIGEVMSITTTDIDTEDGKAGYLVHLD